MVSVLGFSFSGSGQNAGLAFVHAEDWDERKGAGAFGAGASPGARSARCRACAMPSSSRSSPPPIPELGTATGFTFRLQDRGGNGHAALLAARNQLLGMAAQSKVLAGVRPDGLEDAPQLQLDIDRDKASALGVGVRRDQRGAVDRARLGLRQRLPERRPAAARRRAGRRAGAHAARRPAAAQRAQQPGQAGAAVGVRDARAGSPARCRRSATTAIRRCASSATPRRATAPARRWPRWSGSRRSCRPASRFEWTGQSREERLVGRDRRDPARLLAARGVPVPGGAVRELVDPARGDAGGAARRARRGARRDAARHAERRLLQGRPDHDHRPVGEERDPDHRVREGPAGAGQERWSRRRSRRRTCASGRS